MPALFEIALPWIILASCAALLISTWRHWGAPLAITGFVALLYLAIWNHVFITQGAAPIGAVRAVGAAIWLSLESGVFGSLLRVVLALALPIYLLASTLNRLGYIGLPMGISVSKGDLKTASGLLPNRNTGTYPLLTAFIIGGLFAAERAGFDVATILFASLFALGIGMIWFWMMAKFPGNARISAVNIGQASLSAASGFGELLLAIGTAGLVLAVLDRTALPIDIASISAAISGEARPTVLLLAALGALGLGMALPGLAAYLIAAALLGPAMRTVGFADLTIHMILLLFSTTAGAIGMIATLHAGRRFQTTT